MDHLAGTALVAAIVEWYSLEGNDTGGPLHIILDDYNVRDGDLDYCRTCVLNDTWFDHYRTIEWTALGLHIVNGLQQYGQDDRRVIIREAHRQLASPRLAVPMVPACAEEPCSVHKRIN